jgi:glycosyltransferase involved in cell wall biosynthesis
LKYNVECIFRKSKEEQNHAYRLKNIKAESNILFFLWQVLKTMFKRDNRYLIVAISPYTFLSFLIIFFFRKKNIYVYLMSNGHEEYLHILGKKFVWIYNFMFNFVTKFSKTIVCHERLFDVKKSYLVLPSRLNKNWFVDICKPNVNYPKFLYVGRINPEKGIENFISLFESSNLDGELSIAGKSEKLKVNNNKIKLLGYVESEDNLIKTYDLNNITILPSYTEAHPYVLEESLARKRPIIIFNDISYVKKNKFGVYIIKRDKDELISITNHILQNYSTIQEEMSKNNLPTMNTMTERFYEIIG